MTEITTIPTRADYVAASRASYLASLRSKRGMVRVALLILIVVGAVSIWVGIEDGEISFFPLIMLPVALGAVAIGVAINLLWLPRKVERMFRQQPAYAEAMQYRWSDDGFALESPISSLTLRWDQLVKWSEDRAVFLLYITDFQCVFVPKRAITEEESMELRAVLQRRAVP